MEARSLRSSHGKLGAHRRAPQRLHALPSPRRHDIAAAERLDLPIAAALPLAAAAAAAATLLLVTPPAMAKGELSGRVDRVVDGDTLVVDGTRVRLFGIDAPESKQSCADAGGAYACGAASKEALERRIGGGPVRCAVKSKDMYGRSVAVCYAPPIKDGGARAGAAAAAEDLNAWMVSNGWAVSYRRYSKAYAQLEEEAQWARRGIWAGTFEAPDAWRREHPRGSRGAPNGAASSSSSRSSDSVGGTDADVGADVGAAAAAVAVAAPPPAPTPSPSSCLIKGNISAKGAKIYHVPGGRFYEATRIDQAAGERFFCSEGEAVAAGWRPAKG